MEDIGQKKIQEIKEKERKYHRWWSDMSRKGWLYKGRLMNGAVLNHHCGDVDEKLDISLVFLLRTRSSTKNARGVFNKSELWGYLPQRANIFLTPFLKCEHN